MEVGLVKKIENRPRQEWVQPETREALRRLLDKTWGALWLIEFDKIDWSVGRVRVDASTYRLWTTDGKRIDVVADPVTGTVCASHGRDPDPNVPPPIPDDARR